MPDNEQLKQEIILRASELYRIDKRLYAAVMVTCGASCPLEKTDVHDCVKCWLEFSEKLERGET